MLARALVKKSSLLWLSKSRCANPFLAVNRFASNESSSVVVEDRGKVRLIGINRPEKRNAINHATAQLLRQAFDEFEQSEAAVAVLHGMGGTFCAGYDLSELASVGELDVQELHNLVTKAPLGPSHMLVSKPVVGAINGFAVAGGFELALWCDLRVVETDALMGVFCRRFGVPLLDGGTVRLTKLIGMSRAMDLILTGRGIGGKEAFEFGLANRLVPVGTALGQAYNLAQSLVKFPQQCLLADRHSTYHATFESKSLQEALDFEFENAKDIVALESVQGAQRFAKEGIGRHGKFVLDKIDYDVDVTV